VGTLKEVKIKDDFDSDEDDEQYEDDEKVGTTVLTYTAQRRIFCNLEITRSRSIRRIKNA
jgi:hypothetical protein